jgi:hypothetical protein
MKIHYWRFFVVGSVLLLASYLTGIFIGIKIGQNSTSKEVAKLTLTAIQVSREVIPTFTTTLTSTPLIKTPILTLSGLPTLMATPKPIARIGEIIPEVGAGTKNLSMRLIALKESSIAVDGPYLGGKFYTFTAKPGMKFVILIFEFQNNWVREQYTPYLSEGEVRTDKGYFYPIWSPPGGIHAKEYKPRPSTEEEIRNLIGSRGYEKLLPEESIKGCIIFEIPKEQKAIEAHIKGIPLLIRFQDEEGLP